MWWNRGGPGPPRFSLHPVILAAIAGLFPYGAAIGQMAAPAGEAPLEMEDVAREAVSWHPSIVAAAARLNSQEERIDEVKAGYYPQISGGVGLGYDSTLNQNWRPRPGVNVNQRLFDFGKLSSEMDAEHAGVRVSQAQVLLSVDSIARDASYSVIETLRGAELMDAARLQLEGVQSIGNLVEARFQRGAATRSDALQSRSRADAAQATIAQVEAEWRRWQSNLAHLLGREQTPALAGHLPDTLRMACRLHDPDWASVPAMMEAEARFEQANAALRRERAERFPTVSLALGGSTDLANPFGEDRAAYNIGINVASSLFNGGATRARMRGAGHARAAAQAAIDNARLETTRQLAEAGAQVAALQDRLDTLERRYATMRQTRELYQMQYLDLGTRTLVDLLNAEQELSQIRFDQVNARYDLARLSIDCLHASGHLRDAMKLSGTTIEGVIL